MKMIFVLAVSLTFLSCGVDQREAPKKEFAPDRPSQFPEDKESGKIYLQGSISIFQWPEGLSFKEEVAVKSEVMKIGYEYDLYVDSMLKKGNDLIAIKNELSTLCQDKEKQEENASHCSKLEEDRKSFPDNSTVLPELFEFKTRVKSVVGEDNWIEIADSNFSETKGAKNVSYVEIFPANVPETPRCQIFLWGIGKNADFAYSNISEDSGDTSKVETANTGQNDQPECLKAFKHQGSVALCNYDSQDDTLRFELKEAEYNKTKCVSKKDCSAIDVGASPFKCRRNGGVPAYYIVEETGGTYTFELNRTKFVEGSNRFLGKFTYTAPDGTVRKGAAKFDEKGAYDLFQIYEDKKDYKEDEASSPKSP